MAKGSVGPRSEHEQMYQGNDLLSRRDVGNKNARQRRANFQWYDKGRQDTPVAVVTAVGNSE